MKYCFLLKALILSMITKANEKNPENHGLFNCFVYWSLTSRVQSAAVLWNRERGKLKLAVPAPATMQCTSSYVFPPYFAILPNYVLRQWKVHDDKFMYGSRIKNCNNFTSCHWKFIEFETKIFLSSLFFPTHSISFQIVYIWLCNFCSVCPDQRSCSEQLHM